MTKNYHLGMEFRKNALHIVKIHSPATLWSKMFNSTKFQWARNHIQSHCLSKIKYLWLHWSHHYIIIIACIDDWEMRKGLKSVLTSDWLPFSARSCHKWSLENHPCSIGPKIPCMWTNSLDPIWPQWPSLPPPPPPYTHEREQKVTFSSKALLAISHC